MITRAELEDAGIIYPSRGDRIGPGESEVVAALVSPDLERWNSAGRPMDATLRTARAELCRGCVDQVCASCWRTAVYRWIPTQTCPLGFWPR